MFLVWFGLVDLCGWLLWLHGLLCLSVVVLSGWVGWWAEGCGGAGPLHQPESGPGSWASGSDKALVVCHSGTQVSEVLPGYVHPFNSCGCMSVSAGIHEEVIG